MEVLQTHDTRHADSHNDLVICRCSVCGIRRRHRQGSQLIEKDVDGTEKYLATSNLFIGHEWEKTDSRDAHSGLRIDIDTGQPITIRLTPLVICRLKEGWNYYEIEPVTLTGSPEEGKRRATTS
jgi:hypothetical protein